jgi:hypothetical protein
MVELLIIKDESFILSHSAPWRLAAPFRFTHLENRSAQALMPPLRRINCSSRSESGLYMPAYRMSRDHLLRVRLSALPGSAVQRMMAANGSSRSETSSRRERSDGDLEQWPEFFLDECEYRIRPRENYERQLPLSIMGSKAREC